MPKNSIHVPQNLFTAATRCSHIELSFYKSHYNSVGAGRVRAGEQNNSNPGIDDTTFQGFNHVSLQQKTM